MKPACRLSVIFAVQYAAANLPEILSRLNPASHPDVEFLFCCTDADTDVAEILTGYENVGMVLSPTQSPIPELWRAGIMAARAEKLAFSSAHLIPAVDWVDRLLGFEMTTSPAIGGVIENDDASDAKAWAIYLLRYISYSPPREAGRVTEVAADNAIYRRADIMQHTDLLKTGFWEPSFHKRFRNAGLLLEFDPKLRVEHRNHYTSRQFFRQRLAHGKAFGLARAKDISTAKRYLLIVLSPLLPVLFLTKIIGAVIQNGRYTTKLVTAAPWLSLFLLAWGLGEVWGYLTVEKHPAHETAPHSQDD